MLDKLKEIFNRTKPKFCDKRYNQILYYYNHSKKICTKDENSIECETAVDRLADLVNNFNKK